VRVREFSSTNSRYRPSSSRRAPVTAARQLSGGLKRSLERGAR
jgi:hypothetical protein